MTDKLNWKAAAAAGIVAGIVFMMLEMVLVGTVGGQSPWGPPRMIAAMAMGKSVLPPPGTFDLGIVMVAMMIHFMMSIVLGVILGWIISHRRMSLMASIVAGLIFGLLVYFVDFYLMTAVFPWFAMARGAISIFAHAVFGLVLGWVYHSVAKPDHVEATSARVET
jgi:xanthosine utilization system XapX-like protein